eukprot:5674642-Pleurochrysis_carterae.AAC.1
MVFFSSCKRRCRACERVRRGGGGAEATGDAAGADAARAEGAREAGEMRPALYISQLSVRAAERVSTFAFDMRSGLSSLPSPRSSTNALTWNSLIKDSGKASLGAWLPASAVLGATVLTGVG